jgi:L-fuculose-phosphate aldolase
MAAAAQTGLLPAERALIAAAGRRLAAAGLVRGTSGNVSLRAGEHVAITPTGAALADLRAEDVCVLDLEGNVAGGALAPTSETGLHLGVHRDRGPGALVHTHAPFATALSCVLDELPCVHYELLALGGTVRVAPYATFGSAELAAAVVAALEDRSAALMANHGAVTWGPGLEAALSAAELLEWACTVYWRAAAIGTPRALDPDQRRAVVETALRTGYGATRPAHREGR